MKIARRFLLVLAAIALVTALIILAGYTVENWLGARAWETCRSELEARGEKLDAAAFIPPPIPDDQNLAMAPLFVRMYGYRVDPVTKLLTFPKVPAKSELKDEVLAMPRGPMREGEPKFPPSNGDWSCGYALDLAALQPYYRQRPDFPHANPPHSPAEDVLLALTKYAPILDELAQAAAARPLTRFPVNWTEPLPAAIALPHYNALQCMTGALRLRMVAHLSLGRNDEAMQDFALAQRLIDIADDDSLIIAQLVSVAETELMMQPMWEGLQARHWSGPELEKIKTGLRGLDYLAGYQRAMRCERATFFCRMIDYFKAHGSTLKTIQEIQMMQGEHDADLQTRAVDRLMELAPGAWYDRTKAFGCRFMQDHAIDVLDPKAHHVWLAKALETEPATQKLVNTPYTVMVKIAAPVYSSVLTKACGCQANVDHAVIACALEQFYLDRHAYPGSLDELVPGYLDHVPPDVIDGAPTRYQLTPDGRYALWSIGWNGRDDGGQIAWQQDGMKRDAKQGDWVWQYAELQPPAKIQRSK